MKGAHMSFEPIREGLVWGGQIIRGKRWRAHTRAISEDKNASSYFSPATGQTIWMLFV